MFWMQSKKDIFPRIEFEQSVIDCTKRIADCIPGKPGFRRFVLVLCKSKAVMIMLAGGHSESHADILTRLVDLAILVISKSRLGPSALNSVFHDITDYVSLCLVEAIYE